jgi:hypothetical protein
MSEKFKVKMALYCTAAVIALVVLHQAGVGISAECHGWTKDDFGAKDLNAAACVEKAVIEKGLDNIKTDSLRSAMELWASKVGKDQAIRDYQHMVGLPKVGRDGDFGDTTIGYSEDFEEFMSSNPGFADELARNIGVLGPVVAFGDFQFLIGMSNPDGAYGEKTIAARKVATFKFASSETSSEELPRATLQ